MKLCTIRLSVCLAVSQHSEQGSAGCESPPVCSLKPLQAGEGEGFGFSCGWGRETLAGLHF